MKISIEIYSQKYARRTFNPAVIPITPENVGGINLVESREKEKSVLTGASKKKHSDDGFYGRSVTDEIHHPREQCPPIGAVLARTLFRFMEVYPRPGVFMDRMD